MNVVWTGTAIAHLTSIYDFISQDSPRYALRMIGYGEIGFADLNAPPADEGEPENINTSFQHWVCDTFSVTIPDIGAGIVFPDDDKHKTFQTWIEERCG